MTYLVSYHDIVDPDPLRPNVNTVQTTVVSAADGHVVDFAIVASVQREMKGRRVDQSNVVNSKIADLVHAQQARATDRTIFVELVSMALHGTFSSRREELEVGRVLNEDHITTISASAGDDPIKLKGPCFAVLEIDPILEVVVARRDHDNAAGLTRSKCVVDGSGNVAVGLSAIVRDVAGLDGFLVFYGRQRSDVSRQVNGLCESQSMKCSDCRS